MTLYRFYKSLDDNFRKEMRLLSAFSLDQTYIIMQNYELIIKIQWTKQ